MDQVMKASLELAGIVPELWSPKFYPTIKEKLPWISLVAHDYQGEIGAIGDTVHIPSIPHFDAATDMAEDERVDADGVTVATTPLIINHQFAKDFVITKKGLKQAIDVSSNLRDLAFHAIMRSISDALDAAFIPSSAAPDHQIAFDSGTTLALADLLEGKELLDTADVEEDNRQALMGAAQLNDIFNITGFMSRDFSNANAPLSSGKIETPVCGFRVSWSSRVGNKCNLFHPLVMQCAIQQAPDITIHVLGQDGKRGVRVNQDTLVGEKLVSSIRGVQIS